MIEKEENIISKDKYDTGKMLRYDDINKTMVLDDGLVFSYKKGAFWVSVNNSLILSGINLKYYGYLFFTEKYGYPKMFNIINNQFPEWRFSITKP